MRYINGNLLDAFDRGDVKYIANQCNCFASLYKGKAKGIAGTIMQRYPEAVEVDGYLQEGYARLGKVMDWWNYNNEARCSSPSDKRGFNLYAQYRHGNATKTKELYTDYEALHQCLITMADALGDECDSYPRIVGIPRIGCGLAGGDWNVVSSILKSVEAQYDVEFWVYDLEKVEGTAYSG